MKTFLPLSSELSKHIEESGVMKREAMKAGAEKMPEHV